FGALYTLPLQTKWLKQITFGLMAHDFGGTAISFDGGDRKEEILPQNIRFGAALRPNDEIPLGGLTLKDALVAMDIDDRFHFGAEVWPLSHLALRGGIQKDFHTDESMTFSFGGSIKIPHLPVQLDYAYISPPTLPSTHVFSLSLAPSPSPVKIQDVRVDDLFASFYKNYANTPIGYVDLRNDYDQELEVTVKVVAPGLSLAPTQEIFTLGPNQSNTTAFSAIFSEGILNERQVANRQIEITVEYAIDAQPKKVAGTQKFRLYGRGAITWEQPAKAAAFVTRLDPNVQAFADEVASQFPYKSAIELGNIYTAMQLFNALGQIGVRYTDDPNFANFDKTQHYVDFIRYPAELLAGKSGDCDDLTVLYASLLEYSGIRTAFISTNDHITLMFDTGIHERKWGVLPFGESLLVMNPDSTHSIWIPVEVTAVGKPFAKAWQEGANKFYQSKSDTSSGFKIVPVDFAGRAYASALPPDIKSEDITLPDAEAMKGLFENDSLWIARKNSNIRNGLLFAALQSTPGNDSLRNRVGIILAQQNLLDEAEQQFKQITEQDAYYANALVNLGNIYNIKDNLLQADSVYTIAESFLNNHPGLPLNRSVLFQRLANAFPESQAEYQDKSMQFFQSALVLLNNDLSHAYWLLGLPEDEIIEKAGLLDDVKNKLKAVKKFLKDAARSVLHKKTKGARLQRAGIKRGEDKDRGFLLWWAE
ncbi:MAG: hypothetical protein ACE5I1_25160, partial [bacterium]